MLRLTKFIGIFTFSALFISISLFAQDAPLPEKPEPEKKADSPVEMSGKIYAQWEKSISNEQEGSNTFVLKRAYLTANKKLDDVWSVKLTTDMESNTVVTKVTASDSDSDNDNQIDEVSTSTDTRYKVYIKNAYLQAKKKIGSVTATVQFGMIGTPVIGFIDTISGYRWLDNNFVDASKEVFASGHSIDTSADAGIGLKLNIMKMIDIHTTFANGEGYKKGDESVSGDDGKAGAGRLTVMPLEWLYISGYYRREANDDTHRSNNFDSYMGGGVGVKTKLIKVGFNYILSEEVEGLSGGDNTTEGTIIDTWLNLNLNSVIDVPLLVVGRYVTGTETYDDPSDLTKKDEEISWLIFGLGYKFNKYIQCMAYFERETDVSNNSDAADDTQDKFYVKTEFKF